MATVHSNLLQWHEMLHAFEAYAVSLHPLLENFESLEKALKLLLKTTTDGTCGNVLVNLRPALERCSMDDVVKWCLDSHDGPSAVARVTVLEDVVFAAGPPDSNSSWLQILLDEAPQMLALAPNLVSTKFGHVLSGLLQEDQACLWLKTLGDRALASSTDTPGQLDRTALLQSFSQAASALLQQFSTSEAMCAEAWRVAHESMLGDASTRQVCVQRLLPTLVATSSPEVAAGRISQMVGALLQPNCAETMVATTGKGMQHRQSGIAATREALNLAVAFSSLLVDHWKLPSLQGDHNEIGIVLISNALRLGLKDCGSLRKQSRFLLESAVQKALASKEAESEFRSKIAGLTLSSVSSAWRSYWELFDTLEDYSSHLIKASWDALSSRLMQYLSDLPKRSGWPPVVFSSFWLEAFLIRALDHDNDSVQKFVLGQLMCLDQRSACLSEDFILREVLPRFGHGIDSLYSRTDVERSFERQVKTFFLGFMAQHAESAGLAATRLLEALFDVKAVHFTPVRLVLSALLEAELDVRTLTPSRGLELADRFFSPEMLLRMPVSIRQLLASLFLQVLRHLAIRESGSLVAKVAKMVANIPDALLLALRDLIGDLAQTLLGVDADAAASCIGMLLESLVSSDDSIKPMEAAQLALGAVRLLWTSGKEDLFVSLVWPSIAPALQDFHRRSYMPRKVAVSALFVSAYSASLLPGALTHVESQLEARREILSFVESKAMISIGQGRPDEVVQEAPWVWLYALVLERFWHPSETCQVLLVKAKNLLQEEAKEKTAASVLSRAAAASLLGAMAPKVDAIEQCEIFLLLRRFQAPGKPAGVDSRFVIGVAEDNGRWDRIRLEEFEDLHRMQREGLGRIQEWRDASAVVLVAKWRALSLIASSPGFYDRLSAYVDGAISEVGTDIIDELDSLQTPHVAYWAIVARRLAYPAYFQPSVSSDKQEETLQSLCRCIRGFISQSIGDSAVFMSRGCLLELAAALCDPQLRAAEQRLGASAVTASVRELLSLGEVGTGVSRPVTVPLLATLLAEATLLDCQMSSIASSADLLTTLLMHSEYTIKDGALCHSSMPCAGALDPEGPGGPAALSFTVPTGEALSKKFGGTEGLPRILTLTALDALAKKSQGQMMPAIIREVLTRLLATLRKDLQTLLDRPGGNNKPLTPMPLSPQHRLQLRGWQAVLILGCHATSDKDTAEMLLSELFWHLRTPHLPDVRDYQELLGCILCRSFQDLAMQHLIPALERYDCNNQVSASLLVICSFLFRHWVSASTPPQAAMQLLVAVVPYLGHNSAYVRGTASLGFYELIEAAKAKGVFEVAEDASHRLLLELYGFLATNRECQKMRRRLRPIYQSYDTSKTALEALTELSEVLPSTTEKEILQPLHIFSNGDFKPSQTFLELLKDEVAKEMENIFEGEDASQYASSSEHWQEAQLAALRAVQQLQGSTEEIPDLAAVDAAGGASGLQRKFVPPAPPRLPDDSGGISVSKRAPLLVLASLVDKLPNLAGLCRTCEVFHCEALCLPNLKVTSEQAFQSISVTAEKWLPLQGVPRSKLKEELLKLRRSGYTLLGVEQTHTSVPLDQWKFSENTAILLGAEKEGIDAELLPLLDGCVEIPQQGQLRSLNVHVSGSIVIWEYVRQARSRAVSAKTSNMDG